MEKEVISERIGKYQEALSNLCGVEYPYMQGDKDVDAIVELIDAYVQQAQIINEQNDEINVKRKLLAIDVVMPVRCKHCKWYGTVNCAMDDIYSVSDNDFCSKGTRKVVLANDT